PRFHSLDQSGRGTGGRGAQLDNRRRTRSKETARGLNEAQARPGAITRADRRSQIADSVDQPERLGAPTCPEHACEKLGIVRQTVPAPRLDQFDEGLVNLQLDRLETLDILLLLRLEG